MEMGISKNGVTCWAGLSAKINVGNYQSQDISIGLAGVPVGTTPEELEVLLEGGRATIEMVVAKLSVKIGEQIEALGGFRT